MSVDVFVPTYNERRELVRRTVLAAMNVEYPHETWLLDDGNRDEMRELAEELGCHYIAREDNTGAKPGNLNNALQYCKADFIAVIDCDHIAQRDYLDKLLGYFDDPEVAFVQAPQDYYNVNAFQFRNDSNKGLLWHDQSAFFNAAQAGRDYWNATTCCGTSTVVRRSVIDEIGGWPEETTTEDMHVAVRAQKLGYKSVYYPLPLAYGVAPVDLGEYLKQRLRWGQGNVQVCREEGLPVGKGLTWPQKLSYSYLGGLYLEGWTRLIFYITPPLILLTGIAPLGYTEEFPIHFIPFALMTWLCFEELGRGNMRLHVNEQMAMARFPVFVASTFALFRQRIKWQVSSKEFIGHFQLYLLLPQIAVLVVSAFAVIFTIARLNQDLFEVYTLDIILFIVFWAVVNASMAAFVIRDSIRTAANKRPDFRFTLPLPLELAFDEGTDTVRARVQKISATGMTFDLEGASRPAFKTISGKIFIPGFVVPFRARQEETADGEEGTVACIFEWEDQTVRDRLDLSLHSCAWHRKLAWDGAFFQMPLEWIENLFSRDRRKAELVTNHATFLYRYAGEQSSSVPRLGIYAPGNQQSTLTIFEDLPENSDIEIIWSSGSIHAPKIMGLGRKPWPEETASAGVDDVKSYTYVESSSVGQTAAPVPDLALAGGA
eukprot:s1_g2602.t1